MLCEEWPLQGPAGQDSCRSKDPLPPTHPRRPSAQWRRCLAQPPAGLEGLSAMLEEKDLRRVWEPGEDGLEGEDVLERVPGTNGGEEYSDGWTPNGDELEEPFRGRLG